MGTLKKNMRKGSWEMIGGTAKWDRLEQVGTGWSTWDRWDRDRGVSILGGTGWD